MFHAPSAPHRKAEQAAEASTARLQHELRRGLVLRLDWYGASKEPGAFPQARQEEVRGAGR